MTALNMAGQVMQHNAEGQAVKGRNRAKLRNFEEQNRQYKREVMLDNADWKNSVQVQDIEQDQLYQSMVNQWTEQDAQLDKLFAESDHKIENAIVEMYENDYAGTGTGKTAARLAGKGAKKLGQYKSQVLHSLMMAKDETQMRKDHIRDEAQSKSWGLYEKIRFSPVHGHTPLAPELEAQPSKAGLVLGLASSALGGYEKYRDFKAPNIGSGKGSGSALLGKDGWGAGDFNLDPVPGAYDGTGGFANLPSFEAGINTNLGINYGGSQKAFESMAGSNTFNIWGN
jgi:hypothetical protein